MQLKLILPLVGAVVLLATLALVALNSAREPGPQPSPAVAPGSVPGAQPGPLRTATFALG